MCVIEDRVAQQGFREAGRELFAMSTRRFRTGQRPDQPLLLPPTLTEWFPADHPVYGGSALVEELDLTPICADYGPKGQPPYDPRRRRPGGIRRECWRMPAIGVRPMSPG